MHIATCINTLVWRILPDVNLVNSPNPSIPHCLSRKEIFCQE